MPTYDITAPNGRKYRITGATKEGALAALKQHLAAGGNGEKPVEHPDDTPEMAARRRQGLEATPQEFVPIDKNGRPMAVDPSSGGRTDAMGELGAFTTGTVEGIPILGPTLLKGVKAAGAGIASGLTGEDFGNVYDQMGNIVEQTQEANPGYTLAGEVTGAVAPMVALGATQLGGRVLGNVGNLGTRMALSGGSNAAISGVDTLARGGSLEDAGKSSLISGGIGTIIPGLGAALGKLGGAVAGIVGPRVNALMRPANEAEKRVGRFYEMDRAAGEGLTPVDEAAATLNKQPVMNVDRGGPTLRHALRSATNQDTEAYGAAKRAVGDRFESQAERAQSFIDRITLGKADDLAAKEAFKAGAQRVNTPAYKRAFGAAGAQDMSTPGLLSLLNAPAVKQAAMDAEKRGANRAVVGGFNPIRNPFTFAEDGSVAMRDPNVRPTLEFWNQVKINLDGEIGKAFRAGDNALGSDLKALKTKLVSELDAAVPEYKTARAGAAAFFDAEDALDAGKRFVTQNRTLDETAAALKAMKPSERSAFAVGFASELKDVIKQTPERVNVIKKIFGSPQAKEKIRLALGDRNYAEFEQFVKVETTMDLMRETLGGSDTTRKLVELAMASGGAGYGLYTGDWKNNTSISLIAAAAMSRYGRGVDKKMATQMAKILLSDDPNALQRATTMAAKNPQAATALDAIMTTIGNVTRGAVGATVRPSGPEAIGQANQ